MKDTFFFNAVFNYKSETGASKYIWGIKEFDISLSIKDQVFTYSDDANCDRIKCEDVSCVMDAVWLFTVARRELY